ncbi:translation initiation factor IF-2 isoform X2 [Colossoma macropomum]|uniref:translation initiation factor IF-2 isoform X2 n=1 Tax=Colossoma macropomum TaxID=42526 RepID=UPI001863D876|nr:translation initiation factor IF-2 isoform X2 [Colossoma macropomum]
MEETFEKENPPVEVKAPDDDKGGIGRRLRDRDLLRKRKAEAEEKATNQAQSRKRVRKEPSSTPGKKGRPRKNVIATEPQPDQTELQTAEQPEILIAPEETPSAPIPLPAPIPVSVPVPLTISVPETAPEVITQPAEPLTILAPEEVPSDKTAGVLIEDLGPDEEEDKLASQERLVIDQGAIEDPPADLTEQTKVFSEPIIATPITPPAAPAP